MAWFEEYHWRTKPPVGTQLDRSQHLGNALGFYLFNENAGASVFDLSGNQANGSTTTVRASNSLGIGLNPANSTTFATIKTGGPILGGLAAWSVAVGFSTKQLTNNEGTIYCERATVGNDILKISACTSGGALQIVYRNDAASLTNQTCVKTINDGNVHHAVMTLSGTNLRMYIDGLLDTSVTYPGANNNFTNANIQCLMGKDPTGATANFSGTGTVLNYLYLYPFALSPAESQFLATYPWDSTQEPNHLRWRFPATRPSVPVAPTYFIPPGIFAVRAS